MAAQPLLFMTRSHFKPNSFFIPYSSLSLAPSLFLLIDLVYASLAPLCSINCGQRVWAHVGNRAAKAKDGWIFFRKGNVWKENGCHPTTFFPAECFLLFFPAIIRIKENVPREFFVPFQANQTLMSAFKQVTSSSWMLISCWVSPQALVLPRSTTD